MPMLPPAPPRFSIMKVLPVDCSSAAATTRPMRSEGPPGLFATTIFTGRSGYCANADVARSSAGALTPAPKAVLMNVRLDGAGVSLLIDVFP